MKSLLKESLLKESRRVILLGCGNTAKEFYQKYHNQLNISGFLSNNAQERVFSPDGGRQYEVLRLTPKSGADTDALIIICTIAEKEIEEQLLMLGYEPLRDFVDRQTAEFMMSKKKIALLYGVCHLRSIRDALMTSEQFAGVYEAFFVANYLPLNVYNMAKLGYLAENCDVFIYGSSVGAQEYRKNQALLARLKESARVLSIPIVCFGGYFPQLQRPFNRMNRYAVKCEGHDYTPFSYEDSYLNQCIDEGASPQEIIRRILDTTIYDADMITELVEQEWKRIRFQEMDTDVKILDYLQGHYRKKRLFRNEAHMENEVVYEYAGQLLEKMHIARDFKKTYAPFLYCSEHPIFPCTAKTLGLEWDVTEEPLDLYTYGGWKKVSFREYLTTYIMCCAKVKELKDMALLPGEILD